MPGDTYEGKILKDPIGKKHLSENYFNSEGVIYDYLTFYTGLPQQDGWYIVKLKHGNVEEREYDVDYCRAQSKSDGGKREWIKWYPHNVIGYTEIK